MNKKILNSGLLITSSLAILGLPIIVSGDSTGTSLPTMISTFQTVLYGCAVSIVVIGWLIAGILFLLSAGSPEKMTTARRAAVAAGIGTLIVILAATSSLIIGVISDAFGLK